MTWPIVHLVALAAVIAGGLIPAAYVTATYRPRKRLSATQLDAAGWVPIVAALYVLAAFNLVTGQRRTPDLVEGVVSLTIGVGIDGLLWLRAVTWWRMRRAFRHGSVTPGS